MEWLLLFRKIYYRVYLLKCHEVWVAAWAYIPLTFTKSIYSFERLSTCEIYTNLVSGLRCKCPYSSMLQIFYNICGTCGIYMVLKCFLMMFAVLLREPLWTWGSQSGFSFEAILPVAFLCLSLHIIGVHLFWEGDLYMGSESGCPVVFWCVLTHKVVVCSHIGRGEPL